MICSKCQVHCRQKTKAHLAQVEQSLAARGDFVKVSDQHTWNKNELKGGVLPSHRWQPAKKGEPSKPALVVEGPDRGKVIQVAVKPPRKEEAHQTNADYQAAQKRQEEVRAKEHEIRMAILREVGKQVAVLTNADQIALLEAHLQRNFQGCKDLCDLHDIPAGNNAVQMLFARAPKMQTREFARLVLEASVINQLHPWNAKEDMDLLLAAAKRYKVDAGAIRKKLTQPAGEKVQTSGKPKPKVKPKTAAAGRGR